MRQFIEDITSRDGKGSSKKVWFNIACLTATVTLLWVCYKDNMEDWAFIVFYSVYLACLGGFEIIPKMMSMIIEFKKGIKLDTPSTKLQKTGKQVADKSDTL